MDPQNFDDNQYLQLIHMLSGMLVVICIVSLILFLAGFAQVESKDETRLMNRIEKGYTIYFNGDKITDQRTFFDLDEMDYYINDKSKSISFQDISFVQY